MSFNNPLAEGRPDVEAARNLMPPLPHITVDRMLRRAADRIGAKVGGLWLYCDALGRARDKDKVVESSHLCTGSFYWDRSMSVCVSQACLLVQR